MKRGYLSQYFEGVALKYLSAVEADVIRSNQHEFNGVEGLRQILGEPDGKVHFAAKFLYFSDDDDEPVVDSGFLTWYDARQKARVERGIQRCEYRLYFPSNLVSQCASTGDLLVIARRPDDTILAIIAEQGSTTEQQIRWLFGLVDLAHPGFSIKSELGAERDRISYASRVVLEQIGVEPEEEDADYLDEMLARFHDGFPKATVFSDYARSTLSDLHSLDDPDVALAAWMEREEVLYRTLEKHLLSGKLSALVAAGFDNPDGVIRVVQSTLQRRRSRAGSALENHLEQIFTDYGVTYSRTPTTEGHRKPDFIFPGIANYRDGNFPESRLTMLASKATCKDRWRQILNEAGRIATKHLVTLQPAISTNQTDEMQDEGVQLVLPRSLHVTYTEAQQRWLMDVAAFTRLTIVRQQP